MLRKMACPVCLTVREISMDSIVCLCSNCGSAIKPTNWIIPSENTKHVAFTRPSINVFIPANARLEELQFSLHGNTGVRDARIMVKDGEAIVADVNLYGETIKIFAVLVPIYDPAEGTDKNDD